MDPAPTEAFQDNAEPPWRDTLHPLAAGVAVALAVVEALFDWSTWIELNVSVLYSLPLVFAAVARRRRLMWALALALIGVTFLVYASQAPPAPEPFRQAFFLDRALSAIAVLVSAGVLDSWIRSLRVRDSQAKAIQQQNDRLEAINGELMARREEILNQNQGLERRRRELEDISNRKSQMLAAVSHDVRSPVQAITLMAEVIRRTSEKPDQLAKIPELAQRLQASAISLVDFLSEVIDIASFDTGRITINNSEFEVGELIQMQCERLLPMAENKALRLVAEPCDLRLRTDRAKLGRIVGNLLGNAIKFTNAGTVTVSCGLTKSKRVFIRVADTGRGIEPGNLERIFTEFAQVDQFPIETCSGWGLGLAISRRMVQLLGGDIAVQSQLGAGSVFTVSLPPSCLVLSKESAIRCFLGRTD